MTELVSIILPTRNESENLKILIPALINEVSKNYSVEIIVVDDASTDGTPEVVRSFSGSGSRVRLIERASERGLATALRTGLEVASGESVVFMDADTTHHPDRVPELIHVSALFDLVSASRFCAGGSMQGRTRYLGSYFFNLWVRLILGTQIQDNLAGFFIIKRKLLMTFPLDFVFRGYGDYFFRILHLARRRGLSIVEIPTSYTVRPYGRSKSSLLKMVWTYSVAAFELRRKAPKLMG